MDESNQEYLDWHGVAEKFNCGRSKALLIMHAVGVVYVGERAYVRSSDIDRILAEKGEIQINWH